MFRSVIVLIISITLIYFLYNYFFEDKTTPSGEQNPIIKLGGGSEEDTASNSSDTLAQIDNFSFMKEKSDQNTSQTKVIENNTSSSGVANVTIDPNGGIRRGTVGIDGFVPARVAKGSGFDEDCTGGIIFDPCLIVGSAIPATGGMYFGTKGSYN